MENQVLSSTDILLAIFPSIEDQLISIANKFERDLSVAVERKSGKVNFNTPALQTLLTRFPHSYSSYTKCVSDFVDVGRNSPNAAISVLFKLLPIRAKCDLYNRIIPKIAMDQDFEDILDLFLTLFVADCVAQILTEDPSTVYSHSLILIGYKMASKFTAEYEEPLRIQIVKQFSVIFSILSSEHLKELIEKFNSGLEKYDIGLALLLNRYIRLGVDKDVSFELYKSFVDKFADYSDHLKKDRRSLDMWAESLCSLLTQIKPEAVSNIKGSLEKIFKVANTMASDKETIKWYLMLCAVVIIRHEDLYKKEFHDFLHDRILKKKERLNKLEAKLCAFLTIIRGPNMSRSTQFWEWGSYNAKAHYGIEISFINEPLQKQDSSESYTNLFFKHFVHDSPIEKFPDLVGDILVNFASRDFKYFMLTTIPTLISKLGEDRSLLSLHACLSQLVDPHLKFADWAQNSPLNKKFRVDANIKTFFMQVKTLLLKSIDQIVPKEFTNDAYCFELSESTEVPVFSLPFTTSPIPESTKNRILKNTETVTKALQEWEFTDDSIGYDLTNDFSTYETVSESELFTIKMLSFLPRIINTSDLSANDRIDNLLCTALSSSRSISYYALRVINMIFITNEQSRIIIYNALIKKLSKFQDRHHVFILLLFLVRLLDWTLPPAAPQEQIEDFVIEGQCLFLLLMCYPIVEIRELALNFVERLQRFASNMDVEVPIFDTLNDNSSLISAAVRGHIYVHNTSRLDTPPPTDNLCTFGEVATSRFDKLFQFYIEEAMCALHKPNCAPVLARTYSIIYEAIESLKKDTLPYDLPSTQMILFQNLLTVLTHSTPVLSQDVYDKMSSEMNDGQCVANYRNPVIFSTTNEKILKEMLDSRKKTIRYVELIIINLEDDPEYPNRIVNSVAFFKHIHWTILCDLLPKLGDNIEHSPKISSNPRLLKYITEIMGLIVENPNMTLALAANDAAKRAFAQYFRAAEAYFLENKINGSRRFTNVGEMNEPELKSRKNVCIGYCKVVNFFLSALSPLKLYPADGAIRMPEPNPWLNGEGQTHWPDSQRRITLAFLVNWGKLSESDSAEFFDLSTAASLAIIAFIRVITIFNESYNMTNDLEQIIINLEKEKHSVLQYILSTHYEYMLPVFLSYAYNAPPELAPLFFKAVCLQFTTASTDIRKVLVDQNNEKMAPMSLSSRTSSFLSFSPGLKRMARLRTIATFDLTSSLSDLDMKRNKNFAEMTGKFVPISLIYLLHEDFVLRSISFKFLQRIAPTVCHILNKDDNLTAQFVKKLNVLAPSFFSTHVSITSDIIMTVAELFASYLPQITQVLIQEVFAQITTSAKGSFMNQSTKAMLLQITSCFMKNLRLDTVNNWPSCFVLYTPYTLLSSVLDILPSIEQNSQSHYLGLWNGLANDDKNSILITHFLIQAAEDVKNEKSVKVVILHLAKHHAKLIIEELVRELTFASWWNNTLQGRVGSESPPAMRESQSYIAILKTLTDLSQAYPTEVSPHMHIIINFCLLFFHLEPALISELMLIILWSTPQCPESLTQIFLPPCSLIWARAPGVEFTEKDKRDDATSSFTLRQYRKEATSIVDFAHQFAIFLRKHNRSEQAENWGLEALKWACGCGDLLIAGRATLLYSEILDPLNADLVQNLISSFKVVASVAPNETRRFYISSILKALEGIVDLKAEDKDFAPVMQKIAEVVHPLIKYPEEEGLCIAALAIFAKFILFSDLSQEMLEDTVTSIAPLFGSLSRQESLIGLMLAIYNRLKDKEDPNLPVTLLVLFLPTIFKMFSALQNMQPYTNIVSDDQEISSTLESLMLITQCKAFKPELQQYVYATLGTPQGTSPFAFILGISMNLCSVNSQAVLDAAPLLMSLVTHSAPDMIDAVFNVVRCIIESAHVPDAAAPFSQIVEFSTRVSSTEAVLVQETFLRNAQTSTESGEVQSHKYSVVDRVKWTNVIEKIGKCEFKQLSGDVEIAEPIPLAPIDADLWMTENSIASRNSIKDIQVQPFTGSHQVMEAAKVAQIYKEGGEILVDENIGNYVNYKQILKEMAENDNK